MKTLTCSALIGAATLVTCPNLFASIGSGTLTITAPGLSIGDVDGPYNVVTTSVSSGPSLGNYETFCLGSQVDFNSGSSYTYSISTAVEPFAAEGAHPDPSTALSYVALGTAYLYNEFLHGTIGTLGVNNSQNNNIQLAIWYLQGQIGGADNTIAQAAIAANGGTLASAQVNANGLDGVYALNLSPGYAPGDVDGYAQPELCEVPQPPAPPSVPEPGTLFAGAMLLLPFGAAAIRSFRQSKGGKATI
jgi:hypothetical protein